MPTSLLTRFSSSPGPCRAALLGACVMVLQFVGCAARTPLPSAAALPSVAAAPVDSCKPGKLIDGPIRMAITIDDLPGSYIPNATWPKSRVMRALIDTLKAHQVPGAVGFANAIYAEGDADAEGALRSWIDAGFELASHTYSHESANAHPPEVFLADIARNREWLVARMGVKRESVHYFRYPYLERGADEAARAAIRKGLHEQGHRIADVSIDFADWAFSGAYTRCIDRADEETLTALSSEYLQHAEASLYWSAETAQRIYGRNIPHVLLLHAIIPTAINLDALLTTYEKAGVQFISLEEALRDEAYAEQVDVDHGDTTAVWEESRRRGIRLHSYVPWSLQVLERICR